MRAHWIPAVLVVAAPMLAHADDSWQVAPGADPLAPVASAAPPDDLEAIYTVRPRARPRKVKHARFDGWIGMVVGEAGVSLIALGVAEAKNTNGISGVIAVIGGALYVTPTAIRMKERDVGKAFASLGFYMGLPLASAGIGYAAAYKAKNRFESGFFPGLLAGMVAAPIFEGLTLGWKIEDVRMSDTRTALGPSASPFIGTTDHGGMTLGVVGRF